MANSKSLKHSLRLLFGDDFYTRLKVLLGAELHSSINIKCHTEMHGTKYGGWTVLPNCLSKSSIVYSAGVGEDISFDLSVISKYGVQVHAFDPTPTCVQWIQSQSLPEQFRFHGYGIASFDGQACMQPTENSRDPSQTIIKAQNPQQQIESTHIDVKRLTTIMSDLGHSHIDVLKMDIEGAEYDVIDDFLDNGIHVSQFLVEFHHFFSGISIRQTRRSIQRLIKEYKLFYVDPRKVEFSFVRNE